MSAIEPRPSQLVAELAVWAPYLPEVTVRDLATLLGHVTALPSAASLREANLGLLADLVLERGEFIATKPYERERRKRAAQGESWKSATALANAYGSWAKAVSAAARLAAGGSEARVPANYHHATWSRSYTRQEITAALEVCHRTLEFWPTPTEWLEYRRIIRLAARAAGKEPPRLPSLRPIERTFGSFERAISAAKSAHEHRVFTQGPKRRTRRRRAL